MREMLTKAYCFEYNFIEEAVSAKNRWLRTSEADHWFCCKCRVPIFPKVSSLQNCFYSAFPSRPHEPGCPHKSVDTEPGNGKPGTYVSIPPPPIFPDVLGQPPVKVRRKFVEPNEEALAQMIGAAPIAHIYGNLGDVVDAWTEIPESSRPSHSLAVGEFLATYEDIFINLERRYQIPDAQFWPQRIYHFEAKLTPGKVPGIFFVKSIANFDGENGRLPITARVKVTSDVEAKIPGIANRLANLKAVKIFWNGDAPIFSTAGIGPAYALGEGGYVKFDSLAVRAR
ncbi:hypothetical protein [Duganella vulcania]|uniref:Uncharacterized protein n=1 Tax=Duganella vulcania TaxID=2692166 RepID=A0A845GRL8_9BURK|nr:hypothetical protein [Duganella vulcania]MYM96070.1 hypothetical protein [Duganella vulcania]